MTDSASAPGADRLDAAIRRLEAALAAPRPRDDGDLRARHDALVAQVEATIRGLDELLGSLG